MGQDMADGHPHGGCTERPGRFHEGSIAHLEDEPSHQAGVGGPRDGGQADHDAHQSRPQRPGDGQHEDEAGEGQQAVDDPHAQGVHPPPPDARQQPDRDADGHHDQSGDEGRPQGEPGPEHEPGEHVPAGAVGAEEMVGAGTRQRVGRVGGEWIVGGDERRRDRDHHEGGDEDRAGHRRLVATEPPPAGRRRLSRRFSGHG
jgi:hypothetical protein